eukprot:4229866-Prymnesium_polylepis.1
MQYLSRPANAGMRARSNRMRVQGSSSPLQFEPANEDVRRPQVALSAEADENENAAQLDACPKDASEEKDAVAAPQPPQHRRFVRNLFPAIGYTDVKKRRVRLCSDAMDADAIKRHIQSVRRGACRYGGLRLDALWKGQSFADRTDACETSSSRTSTHR